MSSTNFQCVLPPLYQRLSILLLMVFGWTVNREDFYLLPDVLKHLRRTLGFNIYTLILSLRMLYVTNNFSLNLSKKKKNHMAVD